MLRGSNLDLPNEKANVLKSGMLMRFKEVVKELSGSSTYKVVVFTSKKNNIFIAGADIEEIKNLKTAEDAQAACEMGQGIYNELQDLPQTTIAAIHGACVGGGCEMVLACDYRICTDDKSTKIGLPEIQLGVLPGFGGTQRLPRLVGLQAALDIILAGKSVDGKKSPENPGSSINVFPKNSLSTKPERKLWSLLRVVLRKNTALFKQKG